MRNGNEKFAFFTILIYLVIKQFRLGIEENTEEENLLLLDFSNVIHYVSYGSISIFHTTIYAFPSLHCCADLDILLRTLPQHNRLTPRKGWLLEAQRNEENSLLTYNVSPPPPNEQSE